MPLPDDPFIFVSYSSKDALIVRSEIERLKREGYTVWYDQGALQPAHFWADDICQAITACTCFVAFITEDSVASKHVCEEIDQALRENKPFIGIYWDNVELPGDFQTLARKRHTLDRHSMHQSAYEGPLSKALSEHIPSRLTPSSHKKVEMVPVPDLPPDRLPKVVCFALVTAGGISWFLALLFIIAPLFISRTPEEQKNFIVVGLIMGGMFFVFSLGLIGAAFAVFRMYLWRKK